MKDINDYDSLFEELYYKFYIDCGTEEYKTAIESIRAELRESISKEDRRKVLRIVDLYDMIINVSTKQNFKHGFMLAHKLMLEMNNFDTTPVSVQHNLYNVDII